MRRFSFLSVQICLALIFLVLGLLPICLSAGESFHIALPVKQIHSCSGHGDYSVTVQREFCYRSEYPLMVYQYIDHHPQLYHHFDGSFQYYDEHLVVKVPGSRDSPYINREMTITYDGYMLKDRYYATADSCREYDYFYNDQNLLLGYMVKELRPSTLPLIDFTKYECQLDAEGRRLSLTRSSSTDSLSWTLVQTSHYAYTGEAFDNTKDFEKYWPYQPRDLAWPARAAFMAPYVCNSWVLESVTVTNPDGVETVYPYIYDSYWSDISFGLFLAEHKWNDLGLLISIFTDMGGVTDSTQFTWNSLYMDKDNLPELPTQESLKIYPNPFNASTTIKYSLPVAGEAFLKIYNLKGQLLGCYKPGPQMAGEYHQSFDGKDENGRSLASGVYLLRADLPGGTISRRMVLLK